MTPERAGYSGRLVRKGVLIEETYRVFANWNLSASFRENIVAIRETNPIGASNQAWLREVAATVSSRFSAGDDFLPLVALARGGVSMDLWKFCFLWHLGSTDGLYAQFVREFLYPRSSSGTAVFTTDDVIPFVKLVESAGMFKSPLSEYGVRRMARDLLRTAGEFGFVEGSTRRTIHHPLIPEGAILFGLYSLWDKAQAADRLFASDRWSLFLMSPDQVEHELLNLHQFRRLRYERAGSVRELSLPYHSLAEYCESLVS